MSQGSPRTPPHLPSRQCGTAGPPHRSSCWVAVLSSVSSSSVFSASSSSPRSRFCFSALFLAARSESRSSCRSEMWPSSSRIFFRALFF